MAISVFDLFTVGIGPSSSHTVGPMRAATRFLHRCEREGVFDSIAAVKAELFGSLGVTGKGHGTDRAVLMGLEGAEPETVEPDGIDARVEAIATGRRLRLLGRSDIAFDPKKHLKFWRGRSLPLHPNGMRFSAFDDAGARLIERVYYSVGGGFVVDENTAEQDRLVKDTTPLPRPFSSCDELRAYGSAAAARKSIAEVMLDNERTWRSDDDIRAGLLALWEVMRACVERGCTRTGTLPGGLKVERRAARMRDELRRRPEAATVDPLTVLDWINLYALAVNEENAAGGRVVTAPTNGAAGIVPAVLHYYERFCPNASDDGIVRFFLVAGAIGILYKENASISGAEVGCQGEVGVACSMAAGGLVAALGGTDAQIENAAEIGMEHNLGLTCDPVGGLVQIPCIERNAMGAVKAVNAARMALRGTGLHKVSLDRVIQTMRQTGADMKTKYKETSRGGLAINVIEC